MPSDCSAGTAVYGDTFFIDEIIVKIGGSESSARVKSIPALQEMDSGFLAMILWI